MIRMRKAVLLCLTLICLALFCACADQAEPVVTSTVLPQTAPLPAEVKEETPAEQEAQRVTLVAVGDNLLHMPIVNWCRTAGGYDFTPLYANVKDLVQAADMAFVNQEAPLGGQGFAPSGYPNFNSPQEAGLALAETGFTIVNQANNHGLDKGAKAVLATVDFWEQVESATMIGFNRSEDERKQITVVEEHGYRFAWLAYSYGTNGMPMRDSYLMNLIDREAIAVDIEAARQAADAVIVSMHWGNEYQLYPSREQEDLAQFLADQGVLLIIGHHPHVVQPMEWLQGQDGNQTLVIYSLGNFVSNQERRNTMLEGMLSVVFTCDESGVAIEGCGVLPLVMHYESGYKNYRVYPIYDYSEELAAKHYISQLDKAISLEWLDNVSTEIWGGFRITRPGQTVAVNPNRFPFRLATGGAYALAIRQNGNLWGWGLNVSNALSMGTNTAIPEPLLLLGGVNAVSAGSRHSLVIKQDNSLWAWGGSQQGQLGNGSYEDQPSPVWVMEDVQAVSSSDWHTLAIKKDGSLWSWGYNYYGQLGDDSYENRPAPVKIMDDVCAISAGSDYSAALKTDGSLWLWGRNNFGQLGDGTTEDRQVPVRIMGDVSSFSAGYWHSAAVKKDGSLWVWGRNNYGQLGNGTAVNSILPEKVMEQIVAVSVGAGYTLAVTYEGVMWAWGNNAQGQLGTGDNAERALPVQVMEYVQEIAAGYDFALARQADGSVWAWGNNYYGQLGNGTGTNNNVPAKVF